VEPEAEPLPFTGVFRNALWWIRLTWSLYKLLVQLICVGYQVSIPYYPLD
jgi:hypothetical protein